MPSPVAIVLAAGKSQRMKSSLPKVLHEVCGRPLVEYVLDAARAAGVERLVVVVGHEAGKVQAALAHLPGVEFALQAEQKGTGHAALMCQPNLAGYDGPVLILTGDAPLMRPASFRGLLAEFERESAACVVGTANTKANFGLGRIVRDATGSFLRIVEQKDASPAEQAIEEVNVGCYVFDARSLFSALEQLRPDNKQGEYYLTDCAAILSRRGARVVASCTLDISEALGVNTRKELVEVHRALQREYFDQLLAAGVTIVEPAQTYIDPRAQIGSDTIIYPFTTITGPVKIGAGCRIGPHAVLGGAVQIADGVQVGPFTALN